MTGETILFRVEAGTGVGLGHLQRCLALAEALTLRGRRALFVIPPSEDAVRRVEAAGHTVHPLPVTSGGADDVAAVTQLARSVQATVVVVDSYAVDADYLASVRSARLNVVAIDDLAREPLPAHVVVNSGAQARSLPYRSSTGDTRFLLGPAFALLAHAAVPGVLRPLGAVQRVLVTVGGDDPHGALAPLVALVAAVDRAISVTAVVGPFSHRGAEVKAVGSRALRPVTVIESAPVLRDVIATADLAVSAGGQTLYELAVAGTPTIAVPLFENQRESVTALGRAGALVAIDGFGTPDFTVRCTEALCQLIDDLGARQRLRDAARALVDGRGASRVADAVLALA